MTRHPLVGSIELLREDLEAWTAIIDDTLGDDREWPRDRLAAGGMLALDTAATRSAIDPADPLIQRDLELGARALAAAFDPEVVRSQHGGMMPTRHWRYGLLAAVIVRRHELVAAFRAVAPATMRDLDPEAPLWFDAEAAALRETFAGGDDVQQALAFVTAGRRATDSWHATPDAVPWLSDIIEPEMELARCALERDAAFDRAMNDAIVSHHRYYAHPDTAGDPRSQIAMAPLAMACFAHDRGVSTTIESDYAPRWLIENR